MRHVDGLSAGHLSPYTRKAAGMLKLIFRLHCRMAQISRLWVGHALAGEIVLERMVRDGIIRESWY